MFGKEKLIYALNCLNSVVAAAVSACIELHGVYLVSENGTEMKSKYEYIACNWMGWNQFVTVLHFCACPLEKNDV